MDPFTFGPPIYFFFKTNYLVDISPFRGPLITLFWTSNDVCPGFQIQGEFPILHAWSSACNGFLTLTSDATPADLLVASMSAKPFQSTYLYTSTGRNQFQDAACLYLTACDKTDDLPTKLSRLGLRPPIYYELFTLR